MFEWFESWPAGSLTMVDVIASAATALAALLALITIVQAKRQARQAQQALLHERQVDHHLDLLMHIWVENQKGSNIAFVDLGIKARAALLPTELVPITRAACGLPSTDQAKQLVAGVAEAGNTARDSARAQIDAEVQEAIRVTLGSRPGIKQVSGAPK